MSGNSYFSPPLYNSLTSKLVKYFALIWFSALPKERFARLAILVDSAPVAQLVEHQVVMREVVSSTPAGPTLRVSK